MPVVEFEEEEIPDQETINMDLTEKDPVTGEENPNFVYEEDDGEEDEDGNIMPEVTKKEPLYRKEDIFVKHNQPDPVKPPKKKRVLTEEHKAKLAVARVKAMETRKRNSEEKKRIKELEKKAKQKKTKELEDYVDDKPPPVVAKVQEKIIEREPTITKKDIEEAQLDAIMKYEALRKQRKKKKQEDAEEQKKKDETLNAIRRATQPRQNISRGQSGFWDDMY
tara:strand:- start:1263 stop:1928 length:666 start_codon:yes stop_codon:yes gene_type:complete